MTDDTRDALMNEATHQRLTMAIAELLLSVSAGLRIKLQSDVPKCLEQARREMERPEAAR